MKKLLFIILSLIISNSVSAQSVKLKAGTIIPVRPITTINGKNAEKEQQVKFQTSDNVKVDNVVVIPSGTTVFAKVVNNRKATVFGTKGILTIKMEYLILENGEKIYLDGDVTVSGKNKTPLAVGLGCILWPLLFIHGTNAILPVTNESVAIISNTIEIKM